jgi:threonine/homoserine/homoserine lactone efflux protein
MNGTHLWLYFVVVFGIVALPGMDMAYVMGSALLGGRRAGLAAVGGIMTGGVCHMVMGALGVAVVLRSWPPLYNLMLVAGALYVAWMGMSLLRAGDLPLPTSAHTAVLPARVTYRQALITSLVNPKAYLFMLAIFPQFLRPGFGPIWAQAGVLGAITSATQLGVYGALALAAAHASAWLRGNPDASTWTARLLGGALLVVAALTVGQLR